MRFFSFAASFLFLFIILGMSNCNDDLNVTLDQASFFEVEYSATGACCTNLVLLNDEIFEVPDCPDYVGMERLWAVNLAEFNIPDLFDDGDKFSIEFEKADGCEQENCDSGFICDLRHGIPVKILSLRD